jgi:hypothetical protein
MYHNFYEELPDYLEILQFLKYYYNLLAPKAGSRAEEKLYIFGKYNVLATQDSESSTRKIKLLLV